MKKVLVCMLAVGLAATAADASTLRLNFAGGGQNATIVQGASIDVEVWFDISSADTTLAISQFSMQAVGDVAATGYAVELGATDASFGSGLLGPLTGFAAAYPGAGNSLTGVGAHKLGTMTLTSSMLGTHELVIDHDSAFIADESGLEFVFHVPYAGYSGYVVYGDWGGAAWSAKGGAGSQARNPLNLNVIVPEPAGLALLAFGGFAALRRRR